MTHNEKKNLFSKIQILNCIQIDQCLATENLVQKIIESLFIHVGLG